MINVILRAVTSMFKTLVECYLGPNTSQFSRFSIDLIRTTGRTNSAFPYDSTITPWIYNNHCPIRLETQITQGHCLQCN